jgi:hypothetical protein
MMIDPATIVVGNCYVTPDPQVHKVPEIDAQSVTYGARGRKPTAGWDNGPRQSYSSKCFARPSIAKPIVTGIRITINVTATVSRRILAICLLANAGHLAQLAHGPAISGFNLNH